MKVKIIIVLAILLAVYGVAQIEPDTRIPTEYTSAQTPLVVQPEPVEKPTVARLLELTNAERAKVGVKPLILDERLNQSAQMKADELEREGWDDTPHINNAGIVGTEYIRNLVPECYVGSENLLGNTVDVNIGFNWWMNSPSHKEALLNSDFELVGFSIKNGYVAQHFCSID